MVCVSRRRARGVRSRVSPRDRRHCGLLNRRAPSRRPRARPHSPAARPPAASRPTARLLHEAHPPATLTHPAPPQPGRCVPHPPTTSLLAARAPTRPVPGARRPLPRGRAAPRARVLVSRGSAAPHPPSRPPQTSASRQTGARHDRPRPLSLVARVARTWRPLLRAQPWQTRRLRAALCGAPSSCVGDAAWGPRGAAAVRDRRLRGRRGPCRRTRPRSCPPRAGA